MSSHEILSAASNDRKSRLAHLKSLKRKQAPTEEDAQSTEEAPSTALLRTEEEPDDQSVTRTYLSGRNFDPATRNVRLGFESAPISDPTQTLEYKASQIALSTKEAQKLEESEGKPLDLFKLQPKRPNWDLKRDLGKKMEVVDIWTENAIAKIVRERVESQRQVRMGNNDGEDGRQEVGMEGRELIEAMHLKEQEEEAERKREELDDAS